MIPAMVWCILHFISVLCCVSCVIVPQDCCNVPVMYALLQDEYAVKKLVHTLHCMDVHALLVWLAAFWWAQASCS